MKLVRMLFVALLGVGLLTGCGSPQKASGDAKPEPGIRDVTNVVPPKNWGAAGPDSAGKLPEDVARAFLEAKKSDDLKAAWALIVTDEQPSFEVWKTGYVDPAEKLTTFTVGESRSGAPGVAVVHVNYRVTKGATILGKDEWWPCREDQDGTWKLTLQAGK